MVLSRLGVTMGGKQTPDASFLCVCVCIYLPPDSLAWFFSLDAEVPRIVLLTSQRDPLCVFLRSNLESVILF